MRSGQSGLLIETDPVTSGRTSQGSHNPSNHTGYQIFSASVDASPTQVGTSRRSHPRVSPTLASSEVLSGLLAREFVEIQELP